MYVSIEGLQLLARDPWPECCQNQMKYHEMKNKKNHHFSTAYVHGTSTEEFMQFRCPISGGYDNKKKDSEEGSKDDQMCGRALISGTNGLGLFSLEKI